MGEEGVEFSGKTVEDAVGQAEAQLGATRDDLIIDVVTQGSKGVFGIGAESARVRARRKPAPQPVASVTESAPVERSPVATAPVAESTPGSVPQTEAETDEEQEATSGAATQNGADLPEAASQVLSDLLRTMGFDAAVNVRSNEDPIMLEVSGNNLGVLIGRRGDNLAALQFMVNLILSKNRRQWPRIVIDVENYRARREESLRTLADRIAYRVRRSQRPFTLEAMPASDRRIIHLSLRDRPDIETYSIGEGVARRVVIAPKRGAQQGAVPESAERRY